MPLTDEQAKLIKEQILKQVENFPAEKREQIRSYILSMNNQELEDFIIKNKLIKQPEQKQAPKLKHPECVYCLIASKNVGSFIIYEDKNYLAVLEIKPFSKGHTVLIPKKHVKEAKNLKSRAFSIAKKIGKHIVKQLKSEKAKNFQITTSDELKHAVINIIPIYKGQKLSFERKPLDTKQLQEIAAKIGQLKEPEKKPKEKKAKIKVEKVKETIIKLPRRIP